MSSLILPNIHTMNHWKSDNTKTEMNIHIPEKNHNRHCILWELCVKQYELLTSYPISACTFTQQVCRFMNAHSVAYVCIYVCSRFWIKRELIFSLYPSTKSEFELSVIRRRTCSHLLGRFSTHSPPITHRIR